MFLDFVISWVGDWVNDWSDIFQRCVFFPFSVGSKSPARVFQSIGELPSPSRCYPHMSSPWRWTLPSCRLITRWIFMRETVWARGHLTTRPLKWPAIGMRCDWWLTVVLLRITWYSCFRFLEIEETNENISANVLVFPWLGYCFRSLAFARTWLPFTVKDSTCIGYIDNKALRVRGFLLCKLGWVGRLENKFNDSRPTWFILEGSCLLSSANDDDFQPTRQSCFCMRCWEKNIFFRLPCHVWKKEKIKRLKDERHNYHRQITTPRVIPRAAHSEVAVDAEPR